MADLTQDEMLTAAQLAKLLSISPRMVEQLAQKGVLPAIQDREILEISAI